MGKNFSVGIEVFRHPTLRLLPSVKPPLLTVCYDLQSLANQIGWCRRTKDYLIGLNGELHSVATNYQTTVDELRNRGYMADLLPQIEEMNREFQEISSDLIGHIE